jgi:AAA family ATP:ADP antiporter
MTIRRPAAVRPEEARGVFWSFLYFFFLLSSYYLLRPLREARGIGVGVQNLPYLATATFLIMNVVSPGWSALVSRLSRRRVMPLAYRFFALSMLAFYGLSRAFPGHWLVSAAFYVWISIFNLTAVSVFWSFMADVWRSDQSKRLFGLISVGGSVGAIVGPAVTAGVVGVVGAEVLLVLGAVLLEGGTFCMLRVAAWHRRMLAEQATPAATGAEAPATTPTARTDRTNAPGAGAPGPAPDRRRRSAAG